MKIVDLKMYGNEPKSFISTIENYDPKDSDLLLKDKITIMFYGIISALGYDRNRINPLTDIKIVNFQRIEESNCILCTLNIFNLQVY